MNIVERLDDILDELDEIMISVRDTRDKSTGDKKTSYRRAAMKIENAIGIIETAIDEIE